MPKTLNVFGGIVTQQSWSRFEKVMAPKVQGAWHLHLASSKPVLTREGAQTALPGAGPRAALTPLLDFFVCFSSDSALFGSPGQANYAAANAFMDALAHYRRSQGLPALSINWGAWAEVGMAGNVANREQWGAQGIGMIEPAQGLQALKALLRSDATQAAVTPIEWSRFEWAKTNPPFLSVVVSSRDGEESEQAKSVREQLKAAPANQRRFLLETHLLSHIHHVLGWDASDSISLKQGFFDLGLDSLTSVELRTRLQRALECKLPTTLLFDYPTGEALVDYLASLVLETETLAPQITEQEKSQQEDTQALERLDDLQLDDVGDLIDEKLADLERWLG